MKYIFPSTEMDHMVIVFPSILMFVDIYILNHPCISVMNPSCLWCALFSMCY